MNFGRNLRGESQCHGRLAGASLAFKEECTGTRPSGNPLEDELQFGETDEVSDFQWAVLFTER